MPVWPCCTRAGSGATPVSQRKTVLLPEPEKPTRPIFIPSSSDVVGGGVGRLAGRFLPIRRGLAHAALLVAACDLALSPPLPVPDFRHVLAVGRHVPPVLDPFLAHHLRYVR